MSTEVVPLITHQTFRPTAIVEIDWPRYQTPTGEVDDELAALRSEVAELCQLVDALPSSTQMATALAASRLLGKRYLAEVKRGFEQLCRVADNMDVNGDAIDQDEHIDAAENRVKAAIAEWHLVRSLAPKVSLHMRDGSRPNLGGGSKLSDHLRISLLRTVRHLLGGDPAGVVVRGHEVRMPKTCVALIQRCADTRTAAKGLRGDMRGDARTTRLASLLADARLLLGADHEAIEEVEINLEEACDILIDSAHKCEDAALPLAKLYADVRRAHLEKADGLVPPLEGDIEAEFERLSAEYENALSDPAGDRSAYRMRYLDDFA